MNDCRMELLRELEMIVLQPGVDDISQRLTMLLSNYDISKRATDLVIYDDENMRILKRYMACLSIDGKSEKTIAQYKRAVMRFSDFLGKPFKDVGVYDIRYYLACEKERGVSGRTLENTRANLSAFFQWLTQEEFVSKNPCLNINPIRYTEEVKRPFTGVELDALRTACTTDRERALIEVLVTSGIRVSELCAMEVNDIDFHDLSIHVRHGKGDRERITFINDVARNYLERYLLNRSESGGRLFYNKNHQPLNPGGVRHILNRIAKRAGVSNVHPHKFRRTFATNLANKGMDIQEIKVLLGHSDINTTLEYVCVNEEKTRESYRRFIA